MLKCVKSLLHTQGTRTPDAQRQNMKSMEFNTHSRVHIQFPSSCRRIIPLLCHNKSHQTIEGAFHTIHLVNCCECENNRDALDWLTGDLLALSASTAHINYYFNHKIHLTRVLHGTRATLRRCVWMKINTLANARVKCVCIALRERVLLFLSCPGLCLNLQTLLRANTPAMYKSYPRVNQRHTRGARSPPVDS